MNLLQSLQCLADAAGGLIRGDQQLPDLAQLGEAQLRTQKFIDGYAAALRAADASGRLPRARYHYRHKPTATTPFDQERFNQLLKRAAEYFGVTVDQVLVRSRSQPMAYRRQLIHTAIIELTGYPLRKYPFNRSRSGLTHTLDAITSWRQIYPEVKADYEKLKTHLTEICA
jgi:hypothetical protein